MNLAKTTSELVIERRGAEEREGRHYISLTKALDRNINVLVESMEAPLKTLTAFGNFELNSEGSHPCPQTQTL
jgi:hypothetical protein